MIKKLDRYIITTFLGPFLFIFSILFFIFSVQFAFQEISKLVGKGLTLFEIAKLLFYLGTTVIQMVVPLSILLASIMCFGGFGERYELAAMKSTGISLARIILPVFTLSFIIAIILFFFSNNILPDNHKKAKNLLFNISNAKPTLQIVPGQFNNAITGYSMRINQISGENQEKLSGIIIHKKAGAYQNQNTIIAEKGSLESTKDKMYLKFELQNGFIYEQTLENLNDQKRYNQPNKSVQFDTLTLLIDVSDLINKALDEESIKDNFRFYKYNQLNRAIDSTKTSVDSILKVTSEFNFRINTGISNSFDSLYFNNKKIKTKEPFNINKLNKDKQQEIYNVALKEVNDIIERGLKFQLEENTYNKRQYVRMVIHQQRIITFSVMCLIFCLIGTSLGSIIRKGGLGMPVIISIFIFIIWFIIYTYTESLAKLGSMNPYLAAWFPNIVTFPLAIFLVKKAMEDSEIFNIDKYSKIIKKISNFAGLKSKNKEHKRYK